MVSSKPRNLLSGFIGYAMAAAWSVQAQPAFTADLALSIAPPLPSVLAPGSSGTLRITVRNDGPDDAGFTSPVDHPLVVRASLQMQRPDGGINVRFFPPDPPDDCILIATVVDPVPGAQPQWSYGVFFRPIAVGDSASCDVRYTLDPVVAGQQVPITWRVRTFSETDPNPANDSVALVFNVAGNDPPPAMPVPFLSPARTGLLLLAMLWIAAAVFRQQRR